MDAWNLTAFGNDTAADWAEEFKREPGLAELRATLRAAVLCSELHLSHDLALQAIAAADTVARLMGNWGPRSPFSEAVDRWVDANPGIPGSELSRLAQTAIEAVVGPTSELVDT